MSKEMQQIVQNVLPETGLVRLSQIIGDKKRGIWPPIIPLSKSAWWSGVANGIFPKPVKLSAKVTCWRCEDIRALIQSAGV